MGTSSLRVRKDGILGCGEKDQVEALVQLNRRSSAKTLLSFLSAVYWTPCEDTDLTLEYMVFLFLENPTPKHAKRCRLGRGEPI